MKNLLLPGLAAIALAMTFGCATPGTHDSISTTEKTSMPDLNTNAAPSGMSTPSNPTPEMPK